MMLQPTKRELELLDMLDNLKDPKKIEEIRKELIEIDNEKMKKFKNCPFAHDWIFKELIEIGKEYKEILSFWLLRFKNQVF